MSCIRWWLVLLAPTQVNKQSYSNFNSDRGESIFPLPLRPRQPSSTSTGSSYRFDRSWRANRRSLTLLLALFTASLWAFRTFNYPWILDINPWFSKFSSEVALSLLELSHVAHITKGGTLWDSGTATKSLIPYYYRVKIQFCNFPLSTFIYYLL